MVSMQQPITKALPSVTGDSVQAEQKLWQKPPASLLTTLTLPCLVRGKWHLLPCTAPLQKWTRHLERGACHFPTSLYMIW